MVVARNDLLHPLPDDLIARIAAEMQKRLVHGEEAEHALRLHACQVEPVGSVLVHERQQAFLLQQFRLGPLADFEFLLRWIKEPGVFDGIGGVAGRTGR